MGPVKESTWKKRQSVIGEDIEVGDDWEGLRVSVTLVQENSRYKFGLGILILVNMAFIVIETDIGAREEGVIPDWMDICSFVFTGLYVIDLAMTVYTRRSQFFNTWVNMLDTFAVIVDLATISMSKDFNSILLIRTLRILRVIKVLNSVLIFRELYLMVLGLVSAFKPIAFGTIMVAVMLTTWSILAVNFIHPKNVVLYEEGRYGDCMECHEAFRTVMRSNMTFFSAIVAGDSWGRIFVPLMTTYPTTALIIIPAFLTVELGLVNVIAAVIVDRQQQARVQDETFMYAEHSEILKLSYSRLKYLFNTIDQDGGGSLTQEELMYSYNHCEEFRELLDMMDLTAKDVPILFKIIDRDDSGDCTYDEFVERLHYMRHANNQTLLILMKQEMEEVLKHTADTNQQLRELRCRDFAGASTLPVPSGAAMPSNSIRSMESAESAVSRIRSSTSSMRSAHKAVVVDAALIATRESMRSSLGSLDVWKPDGSSEVCAALSPLQASDPYVHRLVSEEWGHVYSPSAPEASSTFAEDKFMASQKMPASSLLNRSDTPFPEMTGRPSLQTAAYALDPGDQRMEPMYSLQSTCSTSSYAADADTTNVFDSKVLQMKLTAVPALDCCSTPDNSDLPRVTAPWLSPVEDSQHPIWPTAL